MCRPVHANLHFGLSPSPPSPDTQRGCFPLGPSSPGDFTRAHREACGEANKRRLQKPIPGQPQGVSRPAVCRRVSVTPRRLADGPTPGDRATSQPEGRERPEKDPSLPEDGGPSRKGQEAASHATPREGAAVGYSRGGCSDAVRVRKWRRSRLTSRRWAFAHINPGGLLRRDTGTRRRKTLDSVEHPGYTGLWVSQPSTRRGS